VGGLSQEIQQQDLQQYFQQFGEVIDSHVHTDAARSRVRGGAHRSKGYGFVTFSNKSSRDRSLAHQDHQILGKQVDVRPYEPDASGDRRGGSSGRVPVARQRDLVPADGDGGGSGTLGWLMNIAHEVGPEIHEEGTFSISFQLPKESIGALMGRKGSQLKEVENVSKARIAVDRDEQKGCRGIQIIGQLMAVYTAHLMLMKLYNSSESRPEDPGPTRSLTPGYVEAARPDPRDAWPGGGAGGDHYPLAIHDVSNEASVQADPGPEELKAEIERLQQELLKKQQGGQDTGTRVGIVPLRTGTRYTAAPRR